MKHIYFFLSFVLIFSTNLLNAGIVVPPTFGNTGAITICVNGSYYLNPSTTNGIFSTLSSTIATVNASGYVTGVSIGTTTVSLVATGGGTVTATVTVGPSSSLSIIDPLAQPSYKFNNNPQGPIAGINNYIGYNGYSYSSQARPSNTGFFRASNQLGDAAGCPYEYYIFRCTTCGTVPEYATRPQGTLTGNTIQSGSTGQLTYTSSNGGGPFTIVYLPAGGSNVTVNNISSTVAFNVASGTPTSTTSYTLISVTDESTNASTDFSGKIATVTVTYTIGQAALGGKIAYILQSGDPGYDANVQHGLVAATSDQSAGIRWYNGTLTNTLATGTALGTGLANTNTIISIQGATATSYAAGLARAYSDGIYHDWYLPSKDELNKLYINRSAIGGFASLYYWSSSEDVASYAWLQDFRYGNQYNDSKVNALYVRAIRAF